ncbi:MAG: L-threonine-O-3-phosphate decarboxylase [Fusobacteria bacterium]|nr:MAG: L-threonine-O-3-phosphate decarboxylase [Fusobacteriota bacterium]KAF0228664.1 MAG: L-threonine-O-3-phosphate [Fusobacteriota bacterium]
MDISKHGGDIYSVSRIGENLLDFSSNVNPMGLPKRAVKILKNSISGYFAYPDINCTYLKKSISEFESITEKNILCGNGAADIIYRISYALRPKRALLLAPTFSEYELSLINVDCKIDYYYLRSESDFILDEKILKEIDKIDILFICNPNNPTGKILEKELLIKIAKKCLEINCVLVIDECFNSFLENPNKFSLKDQLYNFDNLIILKAFTKFFAMAGLRLGYCLSSNEDTLKRITKAGQPWSVSTPAQLCGIEVLKDEEYLKKTVAENIKERLYLSVSLRNLGLIVYESDANFILFKCENINNLHELLLNKKILIRNCENFRGLNNNYFRIAVKSHLDNLTLIETLKEIL